MFSNPGSYYDRPKKQSPKGNYTHILPQYCFRIINIERGDREATGKGDAVSALHLLLLLRAKPKSWPQGLKIIMRTGRGTMDVLIYPLSRGIAEPFCPRKS
jgi:hypothetical protein